MKFFRKSLVFLVLLILLAGIGSAFAVDLDDTNSTVEHDEDLISSSESGEIEVESWEDIQYYSSLNDRNYTLKLKENTNYYPTDVTSPDSQIIFSNNVTIIGSPGAYIGDSTPSPRTITYTAMKVADNSGVGITLRGVNFKWISCEYQPDGTFMQIGGNSINYFDDCHFSEISTRLGRSTIIHIKLGDAVLTDCSFVNCTTDFGCINIFNSKEPETGISTLARMNVTNCYFESNYARTAPGCINNAGKLTVRNSTFCKNSAFWWAGAICTRGGANTTLYDSRFFDNVAGWNGGALYTYSYLQIYNTTFINNNCTTHNGGGAIGACKYQHAPFIYIENSWFENNENTCWGTSEVSSGTGRGGAISIMDEGGLEVRNTTFIKNSASLGTAICAISGGNYGSPYVILVGNRFINHTRIGDVLDIRLSSDAHVEIRDNCYLNNSFEFKKLRLISDEKIGDDVIINIDAELKNPNSFESDILDRTSYDIYVDGVYNRTVVGKTFNLTLKDGKTCNVYASPVISNAVTNEILVGIPKEYVYVSQKSGNDENNGSDRKNPVASISKAVEIAKSKGNIIIMDGTFTQCNLKIDYKLNIIGEDNVKFTGTMSNTIFTVSNSCDLSISNVCFDSIVFSERNTGIIRQSSGFTFLYGCTFNNNSRPSGTVLIEAKAIEIYNSNFTNHNTSQQILIKSNDFLIENCIFSNNLASDTTYYALISTTGEKAGIKATVTDSIFESNTVKHGCIYFDGSSSPFTVENTRFIANSMASNDYSSCIEILNSPVVRIDSSVFMDNIDLGSRAAPIYVSGGYASVYVSNSIILNNSYQNTNNLVFSASSASNLNVYRNLNGNWWGNTAENYAAAPPAHACSSWLVLNMTSNSTNLGLNQKALVTFDFFSMYDKQDGFVFYDAGKLPEFDLDISAVNGTVTSSKAGVLKGTGNAVYTLKDSTGGSLTARYSNVCSTIIFRWALLDLDVQIGAEDMTYGNYSPISFDLPDDVDESAISLTINDKEYDFNKTVTVSQLAIGEYMINLTYSGDSKYASGSFTKAFRVEKAYPKLDIHADETYFGNPLKITVSGTSDEDGNVSIRIGDIAKTDSLSDGKAEFVIDNLEAGAYEIMLAYCGNENYLSANFTSAFEVKKYRSTLTIQKGNVELGSDVILTFTLNPDASGNIAVDVDGKTQNVSVSAGSATYTIKGITKGLHIIEAIYGGDAKYLECRNATEIDIGRINPDFSVEVSDITYGQAADFAVTLNDDATGNVSLAIDGKNYSAAVQNGKAVLSIPDLAAGNKTAWISYSGNRIYLPGQTSKSFSISKAKPDLTIDVDDIMFGKAANVKITISKGASGYLEIMTPNGSENAQIPRTGLLTRTISGLDVGQYSIRVSYEGDANYIDAQASEEFEVCEWNSAQWPNEGYDVKNTQKSPYTSDADGNVAWICDIDADVIGNMAIDSKGNIYVTTSKGIYSIKAGDGSINWIFEDDAAGENFSGIAIGRDMVLAPKSGYKLFFINQTTGISLNNNIFQASSFFAPVVDEEANIYITSEYQTSTSGYNLVVVPYDIWEFSSTPVLINLGNVAPTTAPVLLNSNTAVVATESSLKIIDLQSKSVVNSYNVVTHVRPVVSDNIIYTISDNSIVAITPQGGMWKVTISGTAGNHLSVGQNGEIFAVTKEGVLYEYSTGAEVYVYDFKCDVLQALMVSADNLYVGCANGEFYSIDAEGNLLWKANLNESLSGMPVMDENGMIYVISANRIVAINNSMLNDSDLSASVNNASYNEDVLVDITLDGRAQGTVSVNVGGIYINDTAVGNGHASFAVKNLSAGNYTAVIAYSGDLTFKSKIVEVRFMVSKANPSMDVRYDNQNVNVTGLPFDASGNVSLSINSKIYSRKLTNGTVSFNIDSLPAGNHSFSINYPGDSNYNGMDYSGIISISKSIISKDMTRAYNSGVDFNATLLDGSSGPLANVDVEITVDGVIRTVKTDKNGVLILNGKLDVGSHIINITNPATGEKSSNSATIVKRLAGNANLVMDYSDGSKFKIRAFGDDGNPVGANEIVVMKIGKQTYRVKTDKNGWASLSVSLVPKSYTVTSEYKGFKVSNKITVKSVIKAKNLSKKKSKTVKYSVTLKNSKNKALKSKKVTFKFRGKTYSAKTNKKGVATVTLKNIKVGKFNIKITYLKHTVTKKITIKK